MAADLDPSATGIDPGVFAGRFTGQIGELGADPGVLRRVVRLQREQPVTASIFDQTRGVALTMQSIAGAQRTGQIDQASNERAAMISLC